MTYVQKQASEICTNRTCKKAREAMLADVQLYNNQQVTFKAESFITLAMIGWTYLLHTYGELIITKFEKCANDTIIEVVDSSGEKSSKSWNILWLCKKIEIIKDVSD